MNIIEAFQDWLKDREEKRKFKEMWIEKNNEAFNGQSDRLDEYHSEIAWMILELQEKVKKLEAKQ